jgi:hypothetical protein
MGNTPKPPVRLRRIIPAELVLVKTGSGNPGTTPQPVRWVRLDPLDPPNLSQPVFARSRRRRGNLGEGRLLRLPLIVLGEWLAMTSSWGTPPNPREWVRT